MVSQKTDTASPSINEAFSMYLVCVFSDSKYLFKCKTSVDLFASLLKFQSEIIPQILPASPWQDNTLDILLMERITGLPGNSLGVVKCCLKFLNLVTISSQLCSNSSDA